MSEKRKAVDAADGSGSEGNDNGVTYPADEPAAAERIGPHAKRSKSDQDFAALRTLLDNTTLNEISPSLTVTDVNKPIVAVAQT